MDAYEKVIDALGEEEYKIRHQNDPGFEYLKEDDFCIEVLNRNGEDKLLIDFIGSEVSLFFANDHDHFNTAFDDEIYWLVDLIEDILSNKKCAISLFCNEGNSLRLLASAMCFRKDVEKNSVEEIFEYVYRISEYKKKLEENGGKAQYRYWDPSLNKDVYLEKKTAAS